MGPETTNSSKSRGLSADAQILEAARHNVITTDELHALDLSDPDISYRVKVKRLHRKYRAVYAVGRPDLTLDGVFLAAVRACGYRLNVAKLLHEAAFVQEILDMRAVWEVLARNPNHPGARRLDGHRGRKFRSLAANSRRRRFRCFARSRCPSPR